jgi:hypothetical protein
LEKQMSCLLVPFTASQKITLLVEQVSLEEKSITRELFTKELNHLQEEMMNMAFLVDQAMIEAVESLRVRDMQASKRNHCSR